MPLAESGHRITFPGAPAALGSLVEGLDPAHAAAFDSLVLSRAKNAALGIRKTLKAAMAAQSVGAKVKSKLGAVSAAEVKAFARALSGSPEAFLRNRKALQLAEAAALALDTPAAKGWEKLAKLEKLLCVAAAAGLASLQAQFLEIVGEGQHDLSVQVSWVQGHRASPVAARAARSGPTRGLGD